MRGRIIFLVVLWWLSTSAGAWASTVYNTLTLPALNMDISTLTDGGVYNSVFPGEHTWNGVPFNLTVDSSHRNAFMGSLTIPVNVNGAVTAYTLINTTTGSYGSVVGKVEFYGSDDAYHSVDLTEGINVRDHYYGNYNNIIDGANAMLAYGASNSGAHLDMQIFNLPSDFADETLVKIVFTSYGGNGGTPFIAGATVASAVPVPSAVWLFGSGLVGLAGFRRKRSR